MMKKLAMWILVLGGLVMAYDGLMGKNMIDMLGNRYAELGVYALMGLSALFVAFKLITCKKCDHPHE
ncbi:MAG: hypothetical protein HZC17_09110 [Candidatus Omnitrophica bacterium]|nr:hypothetical protein [Candidatus Omnitrophota bacterium]